MKAYTKISLFYAALLLCSTTAQSKVVEEIFSDDAAISEATLITCDEDTLVDLLTEDFEAYHDNHGVIATSRDAFLATILPECQNRRTGELPFLMRKPIYGSYRLRQIGEYTKMQTGEYGLWTWSNFKDSEVERGKFINLWTKTDTGWKLSRSVTYDLDDISNE